MTVRNTLTNEHFTIAGYSAKTIKQAIAKSGRVHGDFTVRDLNGQVLDSRPVETLEGALVTIGLPLDHCSPPYEAVEAYRAQDKWPPSWLPTRPFACRCKDLIDMRELAPLMHIKRLMLARPNTNVRWLDIGCGRGSILQHVPLVLEGLAKKLHYVGLDIERSYTQECENTINKLGRRIGRAEARLFDVTRNRLTPDFGKFDYVTILNVLHEIPPSCLYTVLVSAVERCCRGGAITIIDMARLPEPEQRAIPWPKKYWRRVLAPLLKQPQAHAVVVAELTRSVPILETTLLKNSFDLIASTQKRHGQARKFARNSRRLLWQLRRELSKRIDGELGRLHTENDNGHVLQSCEREVAALIWQYHAITEALSVRY